MSEERARPMTVVWIGWMKFAYLVGGATGLIVGFGIGVLIS